MTIYNRLTINSTDYTDAQNIHIEKSISENNATSNFTIEFDNDAGDMASTFHLNDKVVVYTDKTSPATTKIFTGIIEDIQFIGRGKRDYLLLTGRDYGAVLQDIITTPRIFKNKEASSIVKSIMLQNVDTNLVTSNNVDITSTTIDKITFNNISIFDALRQLAELSGFYFYVDEDQDLNFKERDAVSSGEIFGFEQAPNPVLHYTCNDNAANTTVTDSMGTYDGTSVQDTLDMHSLVGHWKMNDNAANTTVVDSARSNDGTAQQNTDQLSSEGKINTSLFFNGTTDYIDVGSGKLVNKETITVNFWMKTSTTSGIVLTDNRGYQFFIRSSSAGNMRYTITTSSGIQYVEVDNSDFADDKWHMITMTYDGSNIEAFIDTISKGTQNQTGQIVYGDRIFAIGRRDTVADSYFTGLLDDIRIYDKALTEEEISAIYNSENGTENPTTDGKINNGLHFNGVGGGDDLQAQFTFNTSGTHITDTTGTYTGSVVSGTTFDIGKIGSSVFFPGSDAFVECKAIGSLISPVANATYTMCAWINTLGSRYAASGMSQHIMGGVPGNNCAFTVGGNLVNEHPNALEIFFNDCSVRTADNVVGSEAWHHVAASVDVNAGSPFYPNVNIYYDGAVVKTGSALYATGTPGLQDDFRIGWDQRYNRGFWGNIDDVRIYDRVLKASEVESLYNDGNGTEETPDYIDIGTNINVPSNNHAICFWYKSSSDAFQMLFGSYLGSGSSNIEFRPSDNTILVESKTNNYWDKTFATGINIDDGEWHHYCLKFTSDNSKLFVDGVLADTQTENDDSADFRYRYIGPWGNKTYTYGDTPKGEFDDIRIYETADITEAEILEIYDDGRGTETSAPWDTNSSNITDARFRTSDNEIFNIVTIYGDRQLTGARETFITGTDNTGSIYTLTDKPHNVTINISGTENLYIQPGGVENINNPATDDIKYLVNYEGKQVILTSGTTGGDSVYPTGSIVIIDYQRSTPLISTTEDEDSIGSYGPKHKIIIDRNIKDLDESNEKANIVLSENKDPKTMGTIDVQGVLNITPGETALINLPNQNQSGATYTMIDATYDFNTRNNYSEQVLKIELNKKIADFTDIMKDQMLRLRRLEGTEVDTSIINLEIAEGTINVSGAGSIIQLSIGSAFIFHSSAPEHSKLNSPKAVFGPTYGGSTVLTFG